MNFRNLILGFRNIIKNGIYSIINIAGLAIGMTVVVFILFWVVDELNYDKFNKNLDQMYSVFEHQQYSDGNELFTGCTPFPLSNELASNYPEVEKATTYTDLGRFLIKYEDREYKEGPIVCTDSNFLDVFTYTLLEGDQNSLKSTNQVIITEDLSKLLFGDEPAVGKTLLFNNQHSLPVGAVLAKPKGNTSLDFKVLLSLKILEYGGNRLDNWGNNWPYTCMVLKKGVDVAALETKITNLCKDRGQPNTTLHIFPYKKNHLFSYSGKSNRIQYIYQFLAIAFIIILIASINFINLSVSRAEQRRTEVGVRKVLGAGRINILKQFLLEKGMMILMSILFCIILVIIFMPVFRSISDKNIHLIQVHNFSLIILMLCVLLVVLALSVVYPSMYLSSVNAALALKKSTKIKPNQFSLKNLLVTIQFCLSMILISGSIVIAKQIKFVNQYDLGYNHSNLVYISFDGTTGNKCEALKQELSKLTGVMSMTFSDKLPFWGGNSSWGHDWEGKDPENKVLICKMNVDNNYFKTMGIKLTEGTNFPDSYNRVLTQDEFTKPQVILNEEAIRRMNMNDPVGKFFSP
ncbi:MAG: ABC transporter permease, partial [Prolixibacteraceae bacterium]|nr:ABC transporter permease [Prolixibacteraceae bacterium]